MRVDVAVIGGGPAGLAAALEAYKEGASVVILERDDALGGILNQCIHAGFGLHHFKEELTGPEYANRFIKEVNNILHSEKEAEVENGVERRFFVRLGTMVLTINKAREIAAVGKEYGLFKVKAGAAILAMGCRERTRGALNIPGARPAGVFTAGAAQRLVNLDGKMVGKKVVILGSGDIGLIMARRLTYEGAKVVCVAEIMPYSSGLSRNIVQCLDDYNIPLYFNTTVTRISGKDRVKGVELSEVDEHRRPIKGTEQFIPCDTLLLSVGLIPENELASNAGIFLNPLTNGVIVNQYRETEAEGIFACGNVLHVHDLVDNVTAESLIAGRNAAKFALNKYNKAAKTLNTVAKDKVRYILPQKIAIAESTESKNETVTLYFRVSDTVQNPVCTVSSNEKVLKTFRKMIMLPGEMESVTVKLDGVTDDISISVVG